MYVEFRGKIWGKASSTKVKMKKNNDGGSRGVVKILVVVLLCMIGVIGGIELGEKNNNEEEVVNIDVGVVVDLDGAAMVGKMSMTSILLAIYDYDYDHLLHNHSTSSWSGQRRRIRIVPHFRNSGSDIVEAASAAIDLLKNVKVKAIIGPHRSTQADFVIDICNKAKVPIISLATSPSLSPKENPYFIRAAQCSSSQAKPIAAIVKAFGWREVVFIYEDSEFGRGVIPYLTDAILQVNAQVKYRTVLSPSASDNQILQELYKLMTMQTRVFVVHLLPSFASRLFVKANEAGMMNKGYAWIVTDVVTSLLHCLSDQYIDSMQGVLGVKPYIPKSNDLGNFEKRWKKKFRQENPDVDRIELDMYGVWAYDSTIALAMAFERVGVATDQQYGKADIISRDNLTDLAAIGTSETGSKIVPLVRNVRFKGLSGDFHVVDGQLKASPYEIVNVIGKGDRRIGFWTPEYGISRIIKSSDHQIKGYTTNKNELGVILWPGETDVVPRGWDIPTIEKKLRVGVPVKRGFEEFIKVERDNQTHEVIAKGFCVDVFKAVMKALPYDVPYDFVPFEKTNGDSAGSYDDLVQQISLEKVDAVVGDITIVAYRSQSVDFTLPYTKSGVTLIVPIKNDQKKNAWIFMEPLEIKLWVTTAAFFIYTGFVVWVLEHRVNKEFRGRPSKQMGMIFYFSFSTLVFAHKEKVISNLTRFVVIVWVFVVLVLTSSYTASLTSMLTVQKFNDIHDLVRKGENIGYQDGSFTLGMLKDLKVDETKIKKYNTFEEYDDALSRGSRNGGVAAILDELPYIRSFLTKYCTKYTMAGPTYRTAGFGFALPKGSPLVPDISRAVLQVTEQNVTGIWEHWFGKEADCPKQDGDIVSSDRLNLDSFKGLFLIAGLSSSSALILFLFIFIYENRGILMLEGSVWEKLVAIAKTFDEEKDQGSDASNSRKTNETNEAGATIELEDINNNMITTDCPAVSPAISVYQYQAEVVFGQEESYSTTEPGTPIHETVNIPDRN